MQLKITQLSCAVNPVDPVVESVVPVLLIGAVIGLLVAIMGIGGGFLLVPAMIYLLRMPVHLVPGTSLLQILLVAVVVTVSHAVKHQSVDVLLALVLVIEAFVAWSWWNSTLSLGYTIHAREHFYVNIGTAGGILLLSFLNDMHIPSLKNSGIIALAQR